uniref:Odorant-binding protein 13 n=1 Tax=Matsumurasca onukii TaxID=2912585 RepID=A0A343WGZ0_MATON|nr:odorant-binding protein 13 [Matsumurasca onukii]
MSRTLVLQLLLALAVFSAVTAYNFHDALFNEVLADQLEDWDLSSRVRRDLSSDDEVVDKYLKCKHHHGKSCCGKSKWFKHFGDKSKNHLSECFDQFNEKLNATGITAGDDPFSCSRVNQMKMKVICTTECVGRKVQLIGEDGSIDKEVALKYIQKLELEGWQRPILESAVEKCAPVANSTKVSSPNTGDIECNTALLSLQHCLYQEVDKNCPEDQKKTDGRCKKHFEKQQINTE